MQDMKTTTTDSTVDDEKPPYRWKEGSVPEEDASLLSRLFFFWARPLFRRAAWLTRQGQALEYDDLLPLPHQDRSERILQDFEKKWNNNSAKGGDGKQQSSTTATSASDLKDNKTHSTARIRGALFGVLGSRFYVAGVVRIINSLLQFTFPLLLNAILKFIEDTQRGLIDENDPGYVRHRGYWLSAILFLAMAAKAVCENNYLHLVYRAGYQARVAVSVSVYNKALRLSNAARQGTTLGELVNLMQVDATKIEMFVPQIHVLWDGLLQIAGYIAIIYTLIGWPCFIGLAIMLLAGPMQGKIMALLFGMNRKMVKYTDDRIKTTNECLQGIQSVKMYTWEESFAKEISKSRDEELHFLKGSAYLRGFSRAYMGALPGIVAVASFVVYSLAITGVRVDASTLFAALVAFDQLRFPLLFYPMALAQLAQAHVSAGRVETFLEMREIGGEKPDGGHYSHRNDDDGRGEVIMKDATIYWNDKNGTDDNEPKEDGEESSTDVETEDPEKKSNPILRNVSLEVLPGELCAVVGRVASGKSTLCSALLNETLLSNGEIVLDGSVAYAAQSPWILNATLRDNILFGLPMDQEKYNRVIEACQLTHDLELLDNGDLTEIGEKGINLSGGQKQRVSVARAAYSNADIIILDDPLSALDPEVGKQLFSECILDVMKNKTRLLVTNQLQFLSSCDSVVALGNGEVIEQGTFSDLSETEGGEIKRLLSELQSISQKESTDKKSNEKNEELAADDRMLSSGRGAPEVENGEGGLTSKEERNIGAVSWSVYKKYMQAGGGYLQFALVFVGFILSAANSLANTAWVSYWTSDALYIRHSEAFYLGLYFLFAITLGLFTYMRSFLLARFGVRASYTLHENLLESILRAPQSFFDTTPVGRILSRFSKDMYAIDMELSEYFDFFIFCALNVLVSLGTILFVTPWFGIAIPPLGFLYFRVLNYFRNVSRETKRLESISRSPVYAQFSETLGGLTTIRAYAESTRFMNVFEGKVDHNTRAFYCNKVADRWLGVRLELIGATIAGLAAVFSVNVAISGAASGHETASNFASLAGLSLTFAISLTSVLNFLVRSFAQLEAGMNACERVLYYTDDIPHEAPRTCEALESHAASTTPSTSDPSAFAVIASGGKAAALYPDWPDQGAITLNNLRMRYRSDTPLVLKGLNVTIAKGEKVGVVGRTGSGKSSLLLTLLRIVEPSLADDDDISNYSAPVSIDGVDTLRIGLKDLRSKLGIIPQNPMLFSGTIRSNIDPFDEYLDEQIWAALDQCELRSAVEAMPGMLDASVSEYGENLSAGTRQMLVLGRALLKQCRVLPTSSIDIETDKKIQHTIRKAFKEATVLTIAHRINTIIDSDKVLIMKDGLAEEFAPPQELLRDEESIFSEIVRHAESGQQG